LTTAEKKRYIIIKSMTTYSQIAWNAFIAFSVVASLAALGTIAAATFMIKNALEQR
tara:strand:+ start:359 stop:526 length:168 start_codon:yes stop_codon:yes gene_type:complete